MADAPLRKAIKFMAYAQVVRGDRKYRRQKFGCTLIASPYIQVHVKLLLECGHLARPTTTTIPSRRVKCYACENGTPDHPLVKKLYDHQFWTQIEGPDDPAVESLAYEAACRELQPK